MLLLAVIEATYVFIISAGTWTTWSTWNANYNQLAEGFRAGHLYIPTVPPPQLLARPNPFDWSNLNLWYLDASLYKGHYYLYWGPVPALLLLAVKVVARIQAEVGDQYVLFAFYTLFLIAGAILIARMTARLFPELPRATALIATLGFAYTSPTTYMFATPGIYEAAIGAGQACLLLGLVVAFEAVWNATDAQPRIGRLLAAGCCWAAAVGCRISAVLPAAALVALTALFSSTAGWRRSRALAMRAFWPSLPIALTLAALAVYNRARFDSWLEIGVKYQLNTFPFVTSPKYLPLNIFSYLFRPLGLSCRFPFLSALYDIASRGFPRWVTFPAGYTTHEPQAGLFITSPVTWLSVPAVVIAARRAIRFRPAAAVPLLADRRTRAEVWCVGSFGSLAVLPTLPFVSAFGTTMRYVADFSAGVALLAIWGASSILRRLRPGWPRGIALLVLSLLVLATAGVGLLLGFQGYDEMFRNHNPLLYESLRQRLSFCR
ncbi:MAG TPA: hypothetical protein VHH90_07965 [Polyangia bacterium]|nr:hypothetical protein [Polyangia bacterium]